MESRLKSAIMPWLRLRWTWALSKITRSWMERLISRIVSESKSHQPRPILMRPIYCPRIKTWWKRQKSTLLSTSLSVGAVVLTKSCPSWVQRSVATTWARVTSQRRFSRSWARPAPQESSRCALTCRPMMRLYRPSYPNYEKQLSLRKMQICIIWSPR